MLTKGMTQPKVTLFLTGGLFLIMTGMCWFFIGPLLGIRQIDGNNNDNNNNNNNGGNSIMSGHLWAPSLRHYSIGSLEKPSQLISILDSIPSSPNQPSDDAQKLLSPQELEALKKKREEHVNYGGKDVDLEHLGGFVPNDTDTYERELWEWFIELFNVSSILDVGCGMGYSTTFFKHHLHRKWNGKELVMCVEGSKDALDHSLVPEISVHHDYTKGPWWPEQTFDMVWSAEFLEHVDEQFIVNYMSTFKKAKFILVTHSIWGGWHHSTVHESPWWIDQFESFGFQYQAKLTEMAREHCPVDKNKLKYAYHGLTQDGYRSMSHFHYHGLVFLNRLFLHRFTPFDHAFFQKIGQPMVIW